MSPEGAWYLELGDRDMGRGQTVRGDSVVVFQVGCIEPCPIVDNRICE